MSALLIMIDISCNSVMHRLACTGVCVDLCHAEDGPLSVCVSLHGSAGLSLHALLTQFLLRVKAAPLPALFSTVLHDGLLLLQQSALTQRQTDVCVQCHFRHTSSGLYHTPVLDDGVYGNNKYYCSTS